MRVLSISCPIPKPVNGHGEVQMEPEKLRKKEFVEQMRLKCGVKGRGNDRAQIHGDCDEVICARVNRMRLTDRRRKLIPQER